MKRIKKILTLITAQLLVLGCVATPIYAASTCTGNSIQICYNASWQYMGGAALTCTFNYVDGDSVVENSVSTFYNAEMSNTKCYFSGVTYGHASSYTYAYGECDYLASDDVYYNYGQLGVSCDEYGVTQDYGRCIRRGYTN